MQSEISPRMAEVLRSLPPSGIRGYGRYYLILELADRRWEDDTHYHEPGEQASELAQFNLGWRKLEGALLGVLLALLRIILLVFCWLRLLKRSAKKSIEEIEAGLEKAAQTLHAPRKVVRIKTRDELDAEAGVQRFQHLLTLLEGRFSDDPQVIAYLSSYQVGAQNIGQRWAEAEIVCRKAEASADRAEAFWRGGFLVRAFGFGTIKLVRQLLAILALGMVIPFVYQFFLRESPDYAMLKNLAYGIGWTIMLWSVTLALTLIFNDRRMSKIWERAKVAFLKAKKTRAQELESVFASVKVDVANCLMTFIDANDDDCCSKLVLDVLEHLQQSIEDYRRETIAYQEEIDLLTRKVTLRDKIGRLIDSGSQGDATDEVGGLAGDLLG